ncbi:MULTISPECIES: hypothetical protein [unclassified Mesorhizobium]|nr:MULTISPECIES: hypothetical protein [unclassified Mesorhizobium]TPJ47067.1 hypothetical protein FJ437_11295 [Mesorhizobium sp. B2-6-6]TPK15109.1 hypothetical protein FJ490_04845 [Mesorhizobium sp. B2-5-11]TPN35428.1 hypothetical protein FJ979_21085 [Mesorhizobium sp. B1-1-6]MBZ9898676.1 hypothetical protein [Mesorhizobium sp. BR1-1-6]MBZ9918947.1 hypothetical protein [Mesorhizobium sp. BR1-1-7]
MRLTASLGMLYLLSLTVSAHAYLDPGTGSMLLQGLIAGVAAGTTVLTIYYNRLKLLLARIFGKNRTDRK